MATGVTDGLSEAKHTLLELRLRGRPAGGDALRPAVTRRQRSGPAPLSSAQQQLWYWTQLAPDSGVYNETVTIRRSGPFNAAAFRRAFNEIVRRHEIWRSTFEIVDGEPAQVVQPAHTYELPVVDLRHLHPAERERQAVDMAVEDARRPYDLGSGPLLRPRLVRMGREQHRLHLALHHLIFDGVSLSRIVLPELIAFYDAFAAGDPPPLLQPAIQYADYALWETERTDDTELASRLAHWNRRLGDAPELGLPLDHPRPPRGRFRGGVEQITLAGEVVDRLRGLGHSSGATLFQVMASAFAVLLHRYSGQDDIVFGTVTDLRQRPELESMVGYCLTPLVVRADVRGDPPFVDLLGRIRDELLSALTNVAPFERVVRELRPKRDHGANPIFHTMIVLEPPALVPDASWSLEHEVAIGKALGSSNFDLHISLDEKADGHIAGRLIYDTDLIEPDTAARMVGHWQALLEAIARQPGARISELPLMTDSERHQQLVEWNSAEVEYPRTCCLHELVAAQAERTPDAVAAVFGDQRLTFGELDRAANRVAHHLHALGAGPGSRVAVCVERSLDMLVGLLGVLKAGAAYVPIDLQSPPARRTLMIEDSQAAVVLGHTHLLHGVVGAHRARVLFLDRDAELLATRPDTAPDTAVTSRDPAYVIYTSGSTGSPKGVVVQHSAVINLLTSLAQLPGISSGDRVLALSTCAFDMSVPELWLPLVSGARMVIAPREVAADGHRLARLIAESGVTLMHATPATWRLLVDSGWTGSPELRAVSGGEALRPALAARLLDCTVELWNGYGPTECTAYTTFARIDRDAAITIGRPIANARVYVLDRRQEPVPIGVAGEMYIGGEGVALGYLNRADLTAERFLPDPFVPGGRMYRTGDRARFLADGRIEHLGRLDDQIKIRGFRIEPGEIEAALLTHHAIASAVVIEREEAPDDQRLVACYTYKGAAPQAAELRALLREQLPDYMVPSAFVPMTTLPLTAGGKVERRALPALELATRGHEGTHVAPRTPIEETLAQIWARALRLEQVGVDDDFFELGGHSLLVVRVLAEVEEELGVRMSVAEFVDRKVTIARLAAALAVHRDVGHAERSLVRVWTRGSRPILFFVFPGEEATLALRHFSDPLGPDQPVVAVLGPDEMGRFLDRSTTVEALAEKRIAAIRSVQSQGPYYIVGYSLCGLVAYELAGRLRAAGEHVAWLGLLDAGTPAGIARSLTIRGRLAGRRRRSGLVMGPPTAWQLVWRELGTLPSRWRRRWARRADDVPWCSPFDVALRYGCRPHDAPLHVFTSADRAAATGSRSLGWEEVHQGPLEVHPVPGDHESMIKDPNVTTLATTLAASLRHAQDA